ncbi:hypothetical protein DSO57_1019802 [Entomophthora muscae]|uniref:Uncharacterized protein n=1 Tax=Entomophthora muscae TaxID=34485 RepID=A0ACC2RIP2_9FUNG|nr:hypothetical protein DSO57_1019802 [Entomophthora muscae]
MDNQVAGHKPAYLEPCWRVEPAVLTPTIKEIPATLPFPDALPVHDFITISNPQEEFKPLPATRLGSGWQEPACTCEGITPSLPVAVGPVLGPKSYSQAFMGLAGPGQAKFSCPKLPVQAHPLFLNSGFQECLSSQFQNGNQIGKDPMNPAAKPAGTNDQSGKDRPPASQATVPKDPKNDDEAANQIEEPEIPSHDIQIAPEECPEALACE